MNSIGIMGCNKVGEGGEALKFPVISSPMNEFHVQNKKFAACNRSVPKLKLMHRIGYASLMYDLI